jgi:hypothetical protein
VIEQRIGQRLESGGIGRRQAAALAQAIEAEDDKERLARAEMDDEEQARYARILKEQDDLRRALERSRQRVGVEADDLRRVVAAALGRAGLALDEARTEPVGDVATFRLDPAHPAFARDAGWTDTFDDLRSRPRKRGERPGDWRREAPVLPDGRDADGIVQVHLEHRLVRRLMSRFLSQGFQERLSRLTVIEGPGALPRVVLLGRLAVYGTGAARLHEEIIPVTAIWTEAERDRKPLRPLGESGEERTLHQLEQALRQGRPAPSMAAARIAALVERDVAELRPTLAQIAAERLAAVGKLLGRRGEEEAEALASLLEQQRARIAKAAAGHDSSQLELPGIAEAERRELAADRRHWQARLTQLDLELRSEPARVRAGYQVQAHRLEPVGLVYLWPASG